MGYYINIEDSNLILPQANQAEIFKRWKELNNPKNNHLKRGGSWSGGQQTQWWFSWMDADYDKTTQSAAEILEMLHFDFSVLPNGDLKIEDYDCKTGQEDLFFKTIADLVPAGSYIHWCGEDDDTFSWVFDGKELLELSTKKAKKLIKKMDIQMATQASVANTPVETEQPEKPQNSTNKKGRYVL